MVAVTGVNTVRISLPPWEITATIDNVADRPVLVELHAVNPEGVTATGLSTLPIRHLTMLGAAAIWGAEETMYRMLASPRDAVPVRAMLTAHSPRADHFQRVAAVASWAARSGRPGGVAATVAEFWGVHVRTARRWLAKVASLEVTPAVPPQPSSVRRPTRRDQPQPRT